MLINDSFPVNRKKIYTFSFLDAFGNTIPVTSQTVNYFLVSDDASAQQDKGIVAMTLIDNKTISLSGVTVGSQRVRGTSGDFSADIVVTTTAPVVTDAQFTPGTESNQ